MMVRSKPRVTGRPGTVEVVGVEKISSLCLGRTPGTEEVETKGGAPM